MRHTKQIRVIDVIFDHSNDTNFISFSNGDTIVTAGIEAPEVGDPVSLSYEWGKHHRRPVPPIKPAHPRAEGTVPE